MFLGLWLVLWLGLGLGYTQPQLYVSVIALRPETQGERSVIR